MSLVHAQASKDGCQIADVLTRGDIDYALVDHVDQPSNAGLPLAIPAAAGQPTVNALVVLRDTVDWRQPAAVQLLPYGNRPLQLVVVANVVRLSSRLAIYKMVRFPPAGSPMPAEVTFDRLCMTVMARKLIVENDGHAQIQYDVPQNVSAEERERIRQSLRGDLASSQTGLVRDRTTRVAARFAFDEYEGNAGLLSLPPEAKRWPQAIDEWGWPTSPALSEFLLRARRLDIQRIRYAISRNDGPQLAAIYRHLRTTPTVTLADGFRERVARTIDEGKELSRQLPAISSFPVDVMIGGVPSSHTVFLERADLAAKAEPTIALLVPVLRDGEQFLGYVTQLANGAIDVLMNVRLAVDAATSVALRNALTARGLAYGDVLSGWDLVAEPTISFTTPDANAAIKVGGVMEADRLTMRLSIPPNLQGLAMAELSSEGGAELRFEWHAKADPAISGRVRVPLSLGKRDGKLVYAEGGRVHNDWSDAATLHYTMSRSSVVHLAPPVAIGGRQVAVTDLPDGPIPPDGLHISTTAEWLKRFIRVDDRNALRGLAITCALPLVDNVLQESLLYAEVSIELIAASGEASALTQTPLRLTGAAQPGSTVAITFLNPPPMNRFRISGKAYYERGSVLPLRALSIDATQKTFIVAGAQLMRPQ